jgi:hypothetical protein
MALAWIATPHKRCLICKPYQSLLTVRLGNSYLNQGPSHRLGSIYFAVEGSHANFVRGGRVEELITS